MGVKHAALKVSKRSPLEFFFLLNVKIAEKEGVMFDLFNEFCTRKHCKLLRIDRVLNWDLKRYIHPMQRPK